MEATRYFCTRTLSNCVGHTLVGSTIKKMNEYCFTPITRGSYTSLTSKHLVNDKHLVWQLVLICLSQNTYFKARHVPGRHNVLADSLSRLQVERFLSLTRGMDSLPQQFPHIYNQTFRRQFERIVTQNLPTGLDFSAFRD